MSSINKLPHKHPSSSHKIKEYGQQSIYVYDDYLFIIFHAQFYQQLVLLCTNNQLSVYCLNKETLVNSIKIKTHSASFIPYTNYIVFAHYQSNQNKNGLSIWDYVKNNIVSKISFNFQIQSLKASHRCIILSSLSSLYVIHFPTLKPIYNNLAGNGFNIVYDISQQGLTLAFNSAKKGEIVIRNFTNIQTNRLLAEIRSNKPSLNDKIKSNSRRKSAFMSLIAAQQVQQQQVKEIIKIKGHSDNISLLRLSPNGYRVVSCSSKGTAIRLFSCLTGQLMSEYFMSSSLTTIVDIKFIPQGNSIVCLDDYNQVNLFQTKMIEEELISQRTRRGCEIYEIENPKSYFSFLWFLNDQFRFQRPFAQFMLSTSKIMQSVHQEVPQAVKQQKSKLQKTIITTIKEEEHQVGSSIYEEQQQKDIKNSQEIKLQQQNMTIVVSNSKELPEIQIEQVININKTDHKSLRINSAHRQSNESMELKLKEKLSSRKKSDLSLLKNKGASIKSILTAKKYTEVIKMHHEKNLNFKGIIAFDGNVNINVIRSKYFYKLKYDPFNGGEMFQSKSFNLLLHPVFKQL